MAKEKYKGLILEGRWEYQNKTPTNTNLFKNIYNANTVLLSNRQVEMVLNGHDTIGHIITRRAPNSEMFKYGNCVQKGWKRMRYKNLKKV